MALYPPLQISKRVQKIPQALSIYINQLVYDLKRKGRDITVLSLGEAFFDIPAFDFEKLDFVKGYHYSDSRGLLEIREKIADYYCRNYSVKVDPENEILVSAGSKPVLYFAMLALLNPGDEVLVHEPAWLSYEQQVSLVDAVLKFIPWDCPVKDFPKFFSQRTKLIVLNNPNNPAGRLYTCKELTELYRRCREAGIYLLLDEAYSDFVPNSDLFHSLARIVPDKDGAIVVNSLSKNMGMSGWRVGYIIAEPRIVDAVLKLNQHIITCAPTILLIYLCQYFDDIISITLPQVRETVVKRQRILAMMEELGIKSMGGEATFYLFINIEDFPGTSLEFALHLLFHDQIAVVPGSAYGRSTDRFIRLSIGTESLERIHDALWSIKGLIKNSDYSTEILHDYLRKKHVRPFTGDKW